MQSGSPDLEFDLPISDGDTAEKFPVEHIQLLSAGGLPETGFEDVIQFRDGYAACLRDFLAEVFGLEDILNLLPYRFLDRVARDPPDGAGFSPPLGVLIALIIIS